MNREAPYQTLFFPLLTRAAATKRAKRAQVSHIPDQSQVSLVRDRHGMLICYEARLEGLAHVLPKDEDGLLHVSKLSYSLGPLSDGGVAKWFVNAFHTTLEMIEWFDRCKGM